MHLDRLDLARLSDTDGEEGTAEHLRWCGRCRSVVADHRWLQGEIEDVLSAVALATPVPHPRWLEVQRRVATWRQWLSAGWRASAFAGVALTAGLVLTMSTLIAPVGSAQAAALDAAATPAPAMAGAPAIADDSAATTTPDVPGEATTFVGPTPSLVLPPTPPESEA